MTIKSYHAGSTDDIRQLQFPPSGIFGAGGSSHEKDSIAARSAQQPASQLCRKSPCLSIELRWHQGSLGPTPCSPAPLETNTNSLLPPPSAICEQPWLYEYDDMSRTAPSGLSGADTHHAQIDSPRFVSEIHSPVLGLEQRRSMHRLWNTSLCESIGHVFCHGRMWGNSSVRDAYVAESLNTFLCASVFIPAGIRSSAIAVRNPPAVRGSAQMSRKCDPPEGRPDI